MENTNEKKVYRYKNKRTGVSLSDHEMEELEKQAGKIDMPRERMLNTILKGIADGTVDLPERSDYRYRENKVVMDKETGNAAKNAAADKGYRSLTDLVAYMATELDMGEMLRQAENAEDEEE